MRYGSLFLSLIPATALQMVAPRCKLEKPVVQGIVLGLCMYLVEWRALAASIILESFLNRAFFYICGSVILEALAEGRTRLMKRYTDRPGAKLRGVGFLCLALGMLSIGRSWELMKGIAFRTVGTSIAYIFRVALARFMEKAQNMPRPPVNAATARVLESQLDRPFPGKYLLTTTRMLLVSSVLGMTLLAFY